MLINVIFAIKKYTDKDDENGEVIADFCKITGKYKGSAHEKCVKQLEKEELVIPVIFDNLRGYDSHFIMQEIGEIVKKLSLIHI